MEENAQNFEKRSKFRKRFYATHRNNEILSKSLVPARQGCLANLRFLFNIWAPTVPRQECLANLPILRTLIVLYFINIIFNCIFCVIENLALGPNSPL